MFDRQTVLKATTSIVLGAGLVLAICANASAAEGTTLAMLRPQPISPFTPLTQVRCPSHEWAACRRAYRECRHINAPGCDQNMDECIEECNCRYKTHGEGC
jgi:hypothetical protein